MGFDFATYTKIIEHKLIEYSFGDRAAQVEFDPGPNGVVVRVTFDSDSTHPVEQQRSGWQAILNNFARHVEAGDQSDLRPASRQSDWPQVQSENWRSRIPPETRSELLRRTVAGECWRRYVSRLPQQCGFTSA
jgi:hypothetical protein